MFEAYYARGSKTIDNIIDKLNVYQNMKADGSITNKEYLELCDDLLDISRIENALETYDRKVEIIKIVKYMRDFLGLVSSVI